MREPVMIGLHRRYWWVCFIPYVLWMLLAIVAVPIYQLRDASELNSDRAGRQILDRAFGSSPYVKVEDTGATRAHEVSSQHHSGASRSAVISATPSGEPEAKPQKESSDPTTAKMAENFANRSLAQAFTLLAQAVCFGAFAAAAGLWATALGKDYRQRRIYAITLGLLVTAMSLGIRNLISEPITIEHYLFVKLAHSVLYFQGYNISTDIGLMLAAVLLTIAVCTVLLPPHSAVLAAHARSRAGHKADADLVLFEEAALFYAKRMNLLRMALYVATTTLVAGVLCISAQYHWLLVLVPGPHDAKNPVYAQVNNLISGLVLLRSIFYTVLLAAIYLPTLVILRGFAGRLAEEACTQAAPATVSVAGKDRSHDTEASVVGSLPGQEDWLKKRGLAPDQVWQHAPQVLAILAPIIAGPVGELLKGMAGAVSKAAG